MIISHGESPSYLWWEVKTVDFDEAERFFRENLADPTNTNPPAIIVGQTYTLIIQKRG